MQVVIRVRPPLPRELQGYREYQCTSMVDANSGQIITISENLPAVLSGAASADGLLYATYRCAAGWSSLLCIGGAFFLACCTCQRQAGDSAQTQQHNASMSPCIVLLSSL
jgi:hypothetical protein